MRTVPVNHSAGPFVDGWDPVRLMSMSPPPLLLHAPANNGGVNAAIDIHRTERLVNRPGRPVSSPVVSLGRINRVMTMTSLGQRGRLSKTSFATGTAENAFGHPA